MTRSNTTTYLHLEDAEGPIRMSIAAPEHCAHRLDINESLGCYLSIFATDPQLRQLLGAINERLGLVSAAPEADAGPDCVCMHLAGDNERCVVHGAAVEVTP